VSGWAGAKARTFLNAISARLKSSPDTNSGANALKLRGRGVWGGRSGRRVDDEPRGPERLAVEENIQGVPVRLGRKVWWNSSQLR